MPLMLTILRGRQGILIRYHMEEDIRQMRERHAKEISDLQASCEHVNVSDWIPNKSGCVKLCEHCGKVIEREEW